MRIRRWIASRAYRLRSWWQWRRPIVVRRYVLIERDTAEAEREAIVEGAWQDRKRLERDRDDLQLQLDSSDVVLQKLQREAAELSKTERMLDDAREDERQKRLQAESIGQMWRESAISWSSNYEHACKTLEDERSAAAAQIKSLEGQLNAAIIEAAELQSERDKEVELNRQTFQRLHDLERKYAKLRRAIEDVRAITVGAS